MLTNKRLSGEIIGAAIAVHRELGPGYMESFYEEAMCIELEERGIPFQRQVPMDVYYHGRSVGQHRLDLLVNGTLVVELKAVQALENIHFAITRSYMKAVNTESGLLLNFASMPLTVKRVGRERHACETREEQESG